MSLLYDEAKEVDKKARLLIAKGGRAHCEEEEEDQREAAETDVRLGSLRSGWG